MGLLGNHTIQVCRVYVAYPCVYSWRSIWDFFSSEVPLKSVKQLRDPDDSKVFKPRSLIACWACEMNTLLDETLNEKRHYFSLDRTLHYKLPLHLLGLLQAQIWDAQLRWESRTVRSVSKHHQAAILPTAPANMCYKFILAVVRKKKKNSPTKIPSQ